MTYTNKNNRWYDENNNCWETKEAAEKYSPTLMSCSGCFCCSDCSDCFDCSDCSGCFGCFGCFDCHKLCNIRNIKNQTPKAETQNDLSGKIIEIDGKKYKLTEVI